MSREEEVLRLRIRQQVHYVASATGRLFQAVDDPGAVGHPVGTVEPPVASAADVILICCLATVAGDAIAVAETQQPWNPENLSSLVSWAEELHGTRAAVWACQATQNDVRAVVADVAPSTAAAALAVYNWVNVWVEEAQNVYFLDSGSRYEATVRYADDIYSVALRHLSGVSVA